MGFYHIHFIPLIILWTSIMCVFNWPFSKQRKQKSWESLVFPLLFLGWWLVAFRRFEDLLCPQKGLLVWSNEVPVCDGVGGHTQGCDQAFCLLDIWQFSWPRQNSVFRMQCVLVSLSGMSLTTWSPQSFKRIASLLFSLQISLPLAHC